MWTEEEKKAKAAVITLKGDKSWKLQRKKFFDTIRKIQEANKDADPEQVMKDVLEAQEAIR